MIVVDIETSGLYPEKHGIWQIGALDFYNQSNTFLEEGRIDDEDEATSGALAVTGKTEFELREKKKQPQKTLLEHFFSWTKNVKIKNCLTQNPFDSGFLSIKARKYHLEIPFHHRIYDLHSFASLKYKQIHREFLIEKDHSDMGLTNILKFCGMQDNRQAHNALEDVKLTAECFSRLVYGKPLLTQFSQYKIPEYLKK